MRCPFNYNIICPFTVPFFYNRGDIPSQTEDYAYYRIIHAVPYAPGLQVRVDHEITDPALQYGQNTGYIRIVPGTHIFLFAANYPANTDPSHYMPVSIKNHNLEAGKFYTIVPYIDEREGTISSYMINDISKSLPKDKAAIRLVSLLYPHKQEYTTIDMSIGSKNSFFANVPFFNPTEYKITDAGLREAKIYTNHSSGSQINFASPAFNIQGGEYITLYAIVTHKLFDYDTNLLDRVDLIVLKDGKP